MLPNQRAPSADGAKPDPSMHAREERQSGVNSNRSLIAVVGAGMVGTCTALYLQQKGFSVALLDRKAPGEEASFGNLACFGIASCVPPGMPGILRKVPGMLLSREAPLKLKLRHLPGLATWFLRYVPNTTQRRVEVIAAERQSLLDRVHETLDPLVAEAGAHDLMNTRGGLLYTFESREAFDDASYAFDLRRRNGVEFDVLEGNEARQLEPALSERIIRAIRVPDLTHTYNPGQLVKRLAGLVQARGGEVLRRDVRGFDIGPEGVRSLRTDQGEIPVGGVVIAAGIWSRRLARMLGTNVPLAPERGYHTMFEGTGVRVNSAILSVDHYLSITPMNYGLRVGGIAEFAPVNAPPDPHISATIRRLGEHLIPGLVDDPGTRITEWVGSRPSHPDSKPSIGRAPKHGNAWFAFGHDHLGLTMGSITGKLISELVAGKPPSVDLAPFRPDRF
ncbi:MAG: FAD-dependent oxidoreductase [Rhodobacteraceae bacterium]|nr:FAD-dependent oxidoreductase [Paracoccaceae bacterium]